MTHYDYLIVGSGLYGATFAYKAKLASKKVLVIALGITAAYDVVKAVQICLLPAQDPCGNAALFKIRDCCFIDEPLMLRQFSRYGIAEHHLGINQFIQRFAVLQGKQRRGDAVFAKAASQNMLHSISS